MNVLVDALALEAPASSLRGIGFYTRWQFQALLNADRFHHYTWLNHPRFPFRDPPSDERGMAELPNVDGRLIDSLEATVTDELFDQNERDLRALLSARQYDVYYCTSPFELDYPPALPIPSFPVPTVGTLYDLIPLRFASRYLDVMLARDSARYHRACGAIRNFERVLAISEFSRRDAIALLGVEPSRIVNIGGGVNEEFFSEPGELEIEASLTRHRIRRPYLFYPSGLDWRKNIEGVIEAFGALPDSLRRAFQLVILCSLLPAQREYLAGLIAEAACSDSVVLTGAVSAEDLKCLYYGASAVAFLSFYEGFGLPVLEAMACGKLVVGSSTSSVPEVLSDTGILVDPEDKTAIVRALRLALQDETLRKERGMQARARAREFSWPAVAARTLQALEDVRRTRQRGSPPRLKVAYFSPMPPEESGISDYSAELLPALRKLADVTVYTTPRAVDQAVGAGEDGYRTYEHFTDHEAGEFDSLLFHVGNSTFHREIFDLLDRFEGVVVLHDLALHRILQHLFHHGTGAERLRYPRALAEQFGGDDRRVSEYLARSGDDLELREDYYRLPLLSAIAPRPRGIIVHSHFGIVRVQKERPGIPVRRIPMAVKPPSVTRSEARSRLGVAETDLLVVAPGAAGLTKRVDIALRGFREFLSLGGRGRLVFAGAVLAPLGAGFGDVRRLAHDLGIADDVHFTGRTSPVEFEGWITAADIGLSLRYPSNGETSAAFHRLLAAGVPTIVSNADAFREYPDEVAWKVDVDNGEVELLAAYLRDLAGSPSLRERMGVLAREYSRQIHNLDRTAAEYIDAMRTFM